MGCNFDHYPDEVDIDEVVMEARRRAVDHEKHYDDYLVEFFEQETEEMLREFIKAKLRGSSHRSAAVTAGLDESEGPLLGVCVEDILTGFN